MIQITDQDISKIEKLLLPETASFNVERRNFIKSMESCDVIACPGSGKTTALLAKLLILGSQMPFSDGQGICVLTHTNVAIDEIKKLAGSSADVLFRHPNFFGTIQSFVNKFLAIPSYRSEFKKSIVSIEQDAFYSTIDESYKKAKGIHGWLEPRGGAAALASYWFHPMDLSVGKDLENDIPKLRKSTQTFRGIYSIRRGILNRGILSYNDAYSLALRYLQSFPDVAESIQARFKFVFVDEMQDTDSHQLQTLDLAFDPCKIIMQCLGDPNQAIFHADIRQDMLWTPLGEPPMHFSDTMRYGKTIARLLDTVRVDRQISLLPNKRRNSLPPHLLTYDSGNEKNVLPAFARLIREYKLHDLPEGAFKAVGWVGKDKTEEKKLCLRYYLPDYQKSFQNKKQFFPNLLSYMHVPSLPDTKWQGARVCRNNILSGLVHAINISGQTHPESGRRFTTKTFTNNLRQQDEALYRILLRSLSKWILDYYSCKINPATLRDKVAGFIRKRFISEEIHDVTFFLDSAAVDLQPMPVKNPNVFISDEGIEVKVGTVHSVKGETHRATLYLDTFNYTLDSERLLPFFKGEYPKSDRKKSRHIQNLKIAHVALSRPTDLAAFACVKANIADHEDALRDNGWVIKEINDILVPEATHV